MSAIIDKYLTYDSLVRDVQEFKKSGKNSGNPLNLFDFPSHKYFKILFYFGSVASDANAAGNFGYSNGLLHPTWELFKSSSDDEKYYYNGRAPFYAYKESETIDPELYNYNSAWSYLKINGEEERAELLEKFVTLLSNISSNSPWYFNKISGIDAALDRTSISSGKFEIPENGKITISCLQDSFDNRIETLLELYRSVVWSWSNKREILPANLRKFDMAIYFFESPVKFWHDTVKDEEEDWFRYSYKMIEFHDCEIDYNSIKSGWTEVNNTTGFTPTYNIEIKYNSCYDVSFNEHLMRQLGDIIFIDHYESISNSSNTENISPYQRDWLGQQNLIQDKILFAKNNNAPNFVELDGKNLEDQTGNKPATQENNDSNNEELDGKNLEDQTGNKPATSENSDNQQNVKNLEDQTGNKPATSENNTNKKDVYSYGNLKNRTGNKPVTAEPMDVISDNPKSKVGFLENAIGQVVGGVAHAIKGKINRALLGNLYTYSLTKIGSQISDALKGNLVKTGQSVKQYIENAQARAAAKIKGVPSGNLGAGYDTYNRQNPAGNIGTGYDSYTGQNPNGNNIGTGYDAYDRQNPTGNIGTGYEAYDRQNPNGNIGNGYYGYNSVVPEGNIEKRLKNNNDPYYEEARTDGFIYRGRRSYKGYEKPLGSLGKSSIANNI